MALPYFLPSRDPPLQGIWGNLKFDQLNVSFENYILLSITELKIRVERRNSMSHCPKCGGEVSAEMKFCPKCGASTRVTPHPATERKGVNGDKESNILNLLTLGVILIVLAITYLQFPINSSIIINYFKNMANQGIVLKPPLSLLQPLIFFLHAMGIWTLVLAGLHLVLLRRMKKAIENLTGGLFTFVLAFLVNSYSTDVISGRITLAYLAIAVGSLVVVNVLLRFAIQED